MFKSWIEPAGKSYCPEMLDEAACRDWVLNFLHPGGAVCPGCKKKVSESKRVERFWKNDRVVCEHCGKKFRATSATVLSGMHLSFRELFFILQLNFSGVNAEGIAKKMRVDGNTVRLWLGKLRG